MDRKNENSGPSKKEISRESAVIAAMYNKERGHARAKLTGSIRE